VNHWDRRGHPIGFLTWTQLFEDKSYQIVKQTRFGDVMVSTVWLGFDHGDGDPPVIFETMVFGTHDEYEEQYRYCTEEDALAGHTRIVDELRLLRAASDLDRESLPERELRWPRGKRARPAEVDVEGGVEPDGADRAGGT
jgi:hypothetical protein